MRMPGVILPVFLLVACETARSVPEAQVVAPPSAEAPPHVPVIMDLHTDTLTQIVDRKLALDAPSGLEAGTLALHAGGGNAVVYALWPGKQALGRDRALQLLEAAEREVTRLADVEIARDPDGLQDIVDRGHIAVVIGLEGAHGLEPGGQETLKALYDRGLRVLTMTWSISNPYAGSSKDKGGGLTDEGRSLLALANDLGIVIDVSHASDSATMDICHESRSPVIASHSGADGVLAHPRNLTDEAIRCIGERGGVVGLNLHRAFLPPPGDLSSVEAQATWLARVGGSGIVALGTDFDGFIDAPEGLRSEADMPRLWASLQAHGASANDLEAWKGSNFMRTWRAAWAARDPAAIMQTVAP